MIHCEAFVEDDEGEMCDCHNTAEYLVTIKGCENEEPLKICSSCITDYQAEPEQFSVTTMI